ncbi:MAG: carboxypeptidase-like regulatory domain-containing protein [Proteobacteria bacterium]|nr:carboxypeptidase-like regulatory domain-containing protein [Pseudomonadota bacterium]
MTLFYTTVEIGDSSVAPSSERGAGLGQPAERRCAVLCSVSTVLLPEGMRGIAAVLAWVAIAGGIAWVPSIGHGAPVVRIRARVEVHIDSVRRSQDGVQVRGQIVDLYSREPVPWVQATVRMNDLTQSVRSDGEGVFSASFYVEDGRHDVAIEFAGDDDYQGDSAEMSGVDVSKQSLEMRIEARDVAYSNRTVEITIKAWNEYGGAEITADLLAGPASGEVDRVGSVTTGRDGRGTVHLDRELLGEPGRKRLQVQFQGNRTYNPAQAQTDFLYATATEISLEVADSEIAYEAELTATGRLADATGRPVEGGPIALVVGNRRVTSTLTRDDGSFRLRAPGEEIGIGRFNIQAVFEPSEPWYRPSRSELAQIDIAQPQPVPVAHTLAAFGATALAMVAFLGLRAQPWQRWLGRLRQRRDRNSVAETANTPTGTPSLLRHGLQPARPGLVSTLRRPHVFDFSGTVRDAVTGRPVPGSAIAITHPDAEDRTAVAAENGEFSFDELTPGEWSAVCSMHGYVAEWFTVTVPHRGELRGVYINLVPVRERIFAMYREVAEPLLPDAESWGIWTPRQIFDHVRGKHPASALSTLTDFVEESYFSQRVPPEGLLPVAQEHADLARREQLPIE